MANTDFTARCMAGKALDDVAGKQDVIADLGTIRAGAAAGATAVQPATLENYQPKIDSSHKLDTDLVDDTNSTNKFATQTQLDQIELNKNNILSSFTMVAHASANGSTSLTYDTNINDFNIGGANSDKSSGSYLIICTNWSTTPAPYVGLLTFSGATGNKFVKTDVVTGFSPTITITQNVANATIDISGAAKISIYATK